MEEIPPREPVKFYRLIDLLRMAKAEGESRMQIVVYSEQLTEYANKPFYADDVKVKVRYFHSGEKREVTAYRILSKCSNKNLALRVRDAKNQIEKKGLEVEVII